jgi:hypothetical protein
MELAEALNKATQDALKEQQKLQEEQQAEQQNQQAMTPDQMMAPAMAAAMGGPNAAQAPSSPIPGAGQGTDDLGALLSSLRRPETAGQPVPQMGGR